MNYEWINYKWRTNRPRIKVRGQEIDPDKDLYLYITAIKYLYSRFLAEKHILDLVLNCPDYFPDNKARIKTENRMMNLEDKILVLEIWMRDNGIDKETIFCVHS
jgi:hypothetical protein